MRKLYHDIRGITLIELLIASFLSALIAGAALHFYLSQHKTWLAQNEVVDVQQSARATLDEMASTMRMAGFGLSDHPLYKTGNDSLTIYYTRDNAVDTVLYYLDISDTENLTLYRQINAQSPEKFAEGIERFTVNRISSSLYELAVTARGMRQEQEFENHDGYRRRTLTTRVRVRNVG
jgi:type II secretory pathway pseudopilin PulG